MKSEKSTDNSTGKLIVDKKLNQYAKKILFVEKVRKMTEILRAVAPPKLY